MPGLGIVGTMDVKWQRGISREISQRGEELGEQNAILRRKVGGELSHNVSINLRKGLRRWFEGGSLCVCGTSSRALRLQMSGGSSRIGKGLAERTTMMHTI